MADNLKTAFQWNLRLSETYNTNVRFLLSLEINHIVILRDAELQNHTANACPETVYTVLLGIAGLFLRHSDAAHFATGCMSLVFHRGERLKVTNRGELQPRCFIGGLETGFTDVISTGNIEMIVAVFHPPHRKDIFSSPSQPIPRQKYSCTGYRGYSVM